MKIASFAQVAEEKLRQHLFYEAASQTFVEACEFVEQLHQTASVAVADVLAEVASLRFVDFFSVLSTFKTDIFIFWRVVII